MTVPLSIVLHDVFELDPHYLDLYFTALDWNREALSDAQIVVITQRPTSSAVDAALQRARIPAEVVVANHEFVSGYPIWDNMASLRQIWSRLQGRYITFHHPEFILGPGRLRKTIDWLTSNTPVFALGNLRRPGNHRLIVEQKSADHCIREYSDPLQKAMEEHDHAKAWRLFEQMPTSWWMFWNYVEQPPGIVPYIEDVFYADRKWLEAWRFTDHGGEMPFQDVYDLIRIAIKNILPKYNCQTNCIRMDQVTNRMIHLWHTKRWLSWTPEIRNWFLRNPQRWKDTPYADIFTWSRLLQVRQDMPKTYKPVNDLRNGPGGTVMRYGEALDRYLSNGGGPRVREYYAAAQRPSPNPPKPAVPVAPRPSVAVPLKESSPLLTMIVSCIRERPREYMDFFLWTLREWNADAIDRVQVILTQQDSRDTRPRELASKYDLPILVVDPKHPRAGDFAIWDIMAETRLAWPKIAGKWVTWTHSENVWLKGRLGRTIQYLENTDRKLVLGNLRRFDYRFNGGNEPVPQFDIGVGWTKILMRERDPDKCERVPAIHWPKWLPKDAVKPGENVAWEEDLFFADRKWLESWRMAWHCHSMPFQDVYDVMGTAVRFMEYKPISRMAPDVHTQLHMSHEKYFSYFTPEVRDWFMRNPKWRRTQFANRELWEKLIANRDQPEVNRPNMTELRWGPGGTVTRYMDALKLFLGKR